MAVVMDASVTLVGGTSVQVVVSASDGGGGTAIGAVQTTVDVNAVQPVTTTVTTNKLETYVSVATLGTYTSGTVRVRIAYL
ncbi:MAG: hypothetical protein ACW98X_16735 [Promethearchaeota archaeon]